MPGGSKSERTKLRIQQAAAKLFASRSFETVSTRAIAKEAGVDAVPDNESGSAAQSKEGGMKQS